MNKSSSVAATGGLPICEDCLYFIALTPTFAVCGHEDAIDRSPDLVYGHEDKRPRLTCGSLRAIPKTRCGTEGSWFRARQTGLVIGDPIHEPGT
jgi:hypothetical protein